MDIIWGHMSKMKSAGGTILFPRLCKVAQLVLILPHSNVEEERVFSMVTKNKTMFRPNLSIDGTLSSILTVKLGNQEACEKFNPHQDIIASAKKSP